MAFSSVIGASSVIKPGVVTSSTRPSTPFVGQLVYETDTANLKAYNGSAWITQNGLQLITTATPSAVTSVSINNCFSSIYENYLVLFSPTSFSSASTTGITIRLRVSGTDSTTNYASQRLFAEATSVSTLANPNGTDEWIFGYGKSGINGQPSMRAELFKPFLATPTGYLSSTYGNDSSPFIAIVNGTNTASTSYDGFTVSMDAGTITGTIRVYGYANS
jgi:hypothetical protein